MLLQTLNHLINEESFIPHQEKIAINVTENETNYIIQANCQGFKKDELSIEIEDQYLQINAEKKETPKQQTIWQEFAQNNNMTRVIKLKKVNTDTIKANFNDGILQIDLEKSKDTQKRLINIS